MDEDDELPSSIIYFRPMRMTIGQDTEGRIFVSIDDLLENIEGLRLELEMKTIDQDDIVVKAHATATITALDTVVGMVIDYNIPEEED